MTEKPEKPEKQTFWFRRDVQPDEVTLVYSNTTSKTIKDRSTTTSTISVPDVMNIVDVNVQLSISHTRDQDLDVYLVAPDGTRVQLFTDVGGNGDHFTGTILDDQASTSVTLRTFSNTGSSIR